MYKQLGNLTQDSREAPAQKSACLPENGGENGAKAQATCGCDDAREYHTMGQPGVAPRLWDCAQCPVGATCGGATWMHMSSRPGWFMVLPSCITSTSSGTTEPVSLKKNKPCLAVPQFYPCSSIDYAARGKGRVSIFNTSDDVLKRNQQKQQDRCPGGARLQRIEERRRRSLSSPLSSPVRSTDTLTPPTGVVWNISRQCVKGQTGFLCGACADGYSLTTSNGLCSMCDIEQNAVFPVLVIGVILGGLLVLALANQIGARVQRVYGPTRLERRIMHVISHATMTTGGVATIKTSFSEFARTGNNAPAGASASRLSHATFAKFLRANKMIRTSDPDRSLNSVLLKLDADHDGFVTWHELGNFMMRDLGHSRPLSPALENQKKKVSLECIHTVSCSLGGFRLCRSGRSLRSLPPLGRGSMLCASWVLYVFLSFGRCGG